MDSTRFDALTRILGTGQSATPSRRAVLALLGSGVAASVMPVVNTEARKRKKHKKRKKHHRGGGGGGGELGLRELCDPAATTAAETCQAGLDCDTPTTRHTCSDTVQGVDTWCCVPPGGSCTECDCCGDFYCAFDDNNEPHCVPNPEG